MALDIGLGLVLERPRWLSPAAVKCPLAMRTVRLAILGSSPCDQCDAACCKQNGHEFAVLLHADERRRFAAWSVDLPVKSASGIVLERVIAYRDGRCPFLGDDDRCTIYQDRPLSCRRFECVQFFNEHGVGRHGPFLQLNPRVAALLERLEGTSERITGRVCRQRRDSL